MKKAIMLVLVLALAAAPAAAQVVWNEIGDAGDLLDTAQYTICDITLDEIRGVSTGGNDVDLYIITIADPGLFEATTCAGTAMDTKIMLFDLNGLGVTYNDDDPDECAPGGLQSTITGTYVTAGDQFYLAITRYPSLPQSAGGGIWLSSPFDTERQPDGLGAASPLTSWTYSTSTTPYDYTIYLRGVGCSGPVATETSTWGTVKTLFQ